MKSITLHGIDDALEKKITAKSKELNLSQNKTVKKLLEDALSGSKRQKKIEEFTELFGKWTEEERRAFEERIADMNRVSDADWQS